MINTEKEYESTKLALEHAEKALVALKEKLLKASPERYYILSDSYLKHIYNLRSEINKYIGIQEAEEKTMPLWIKLKGSAIGYGKISISVLDSFVHDFRLGVQRIVEYILENEIRKTGRRTEYIRSLSDIKITMLPGSVRLGISYTHPTDKKLLSGEIIKNPTEEAIKKIIAGSEWAVGLDTREIEDAIPDINERNLILKQIDAISPRPETGISDVEFSGKYTPKAPVRLTSKSTNKIKTIINKGTPSESKSFMGVIREVDLDSKKFRLKESPNFEKPIKCSYQESIEEDIIGGLNKKVKITGVLHFKNQKVSHMDVYQMESLKS